MVHCCIIGCNSRSERKTENITFHTFPKNYWTKRQLWIRATGRKNWEPTKFTRICSRHFQENCFRKTQHMTYLNAFAVPTLHVVKLDPDISGESTAADIQELENTSTATTVTVMETETYGIPTIEKLSMSREAMDLETSSDKNLTPIGQANSTTAETITPRKQKLVKQLSRQTLLAQTRRKKLAALRSKYRRLENKNAELSAIIQKLQTKHNIQEAADLLSSVDPNDTHYLKSNRSKSTYKRRRTRLRMRLDIVRSNAAIGRSLGWRNLTEG